MTRGYISIGSNVDRNYFIVKGIDSLKQTFGDLVLSSLYESEPIGFEGDPFYNLIAGFDSKLDVYVVAQLLRLIEQQYGRTADSKKFSSRSLDLDLVIYGNLILDDDRLQLPRREIEHYPFVLEPLAEIAPEQIHPVLQVCYADLWQHMASSSQKQWRVPYPTAMP